MNPVFAHGSAVGAPFVPPEVERSRTVRVGSCAWSFEDWRGVFYPEHLGHQHWLQFYSGYLDTVEIDSTFYAPPSLHTAAHWREITPPRFLFSAKMPRSITHEHQLHGCAFLLESFLAALEPLREKLACVLIQLPPTFSLGFGEHRLRDFIRSLPPNFRYAIEFRDPTWHLPRIVHLLEEHRIAWVWHDVSSLDHSLEGAFESLPRTTDFLYLRLLGDLKTKYGGDGSRVHQYRGLLWPRDQSLESWMVRVSQYLPELRQVFIYANNHFEGFAPHTAQKIAERFGFQLTLPKPEELASQIAPPRQQMELF